MFKKGFTLAETLVTLVIIGVIAGITIPTLLNNSGKEQTLSGLKKVYSTLSNATRLAYIDYGPVEYWQVDEGPEGSKYFLDTYIAPYVNVLKNCGLEYKGNCEFKYKYINDPNEHKFGSDYARLILNDGAIVAMTTHLSTSSKGEPTYKVNVKVDINGSKKPNRYGRDIFLFQYVVFAGTGSTGQKFNGKLIPYSLSKDRKDIMDPNDKYSCNRKSIGESCAALIMFDNWQISDDYPW